MKKWLIASVLAGLASAAPTATPVNVPYFDSVTLRGGGSLVVRHGAQQSVTLVSGDLETSGFTVDEHGKLEIEACRRRCSNYRLQVEIVTPGLEGIAVDGGGTIQAEGDFPDRDALALAIDGGGEIDATAIRALRRRRDQRRRLDPDARPRAAHGRDPKRRRGPLSRQSDGHVRDQRRRLGQPPRPLERDPP